MSKKLKIILGIAICLGLTAGAVVFYLAAHAEPMQEALKAMESDALVEVVEKDSIVFTPLKTQADKALIIYPGGKVDPRAYAPAARTFAEQGVKTVIVKMPFHLAIFGFNKADEVIKQNSEIKHWYISGHSLGGVMAARYAKSHQQNIEGLILWAAYPERSTDLSQSTIQVMSIYGTKDGLTLPGRLSDTQHLLPDTVQWISISGGNHSQFGWYGFQKGDNQADISRAEQQKEIIEATLELIKPNK